MHGLARAQEGRALVRLKHDEPALALANALANALASSLASALANALATALAETLADTQAAVLTQQQALALDPLQVPWRGGLMSKRNTLAVVLLRIGQAGPALPAAQRSWDEATALAKSEGAHSRSGNRARWH